MILPALIFACAAALSSAQPIPRADSAVSVPTSLVPMNKSVSPGLSIPEPNYVPVDTTPNRLDGLGSNPTPKERAPGFLSRTLGSAALLTGGALLTYAGIAYWRNRDVADDVAERAGANPLGLMAVATVSIPIGAALAVFGGASLIANLSDLGGSEDDPER